MGQLLRGSGKTAIPAKSRRTASFSNASRFPNWVTVDGSPGPHGARVASCRGRAATTSMCSYACPWAHRALLYPNPAGGSRMVIGISVVHPVNMENGWEFGSYPGADTRQDLAGRATCTEWYTRAEPSHSGKGDGTPPPPPPVLWDRATRRHRETTIRRHHRMLGGTAFRGFRRTWVDFQPADKLEEIDEINGLCYRTHQQRACTEPAFAPVPQQAYEDGPVGRDVSEAFGSARRAALSHRRFLHGDQLLEVRSPSLHPRLILSSRSIYLSLSSCNVRPLSEYPNLRTPHPGCSDLDGVRGHPCFSTISSTITICPPPHQSLWNHSRRGLGRSSTGRIGHL